MAKKKKGQRKIRPWACVWVILIILSITGGAYSGYRALQIDFGEMVDIELDELEPGGIVNILLLGTDLGSDRSDTIMLVNINGETGKVNILSIPRDTAIASRNSSGEIIYRNGAPVYNKINAYLAIGRQEVAKGEIEIPEELVVRKVKEITGLPIHYFATIDFDGFINIIDALGGVDYNVPEDMHYDDPVQDLHIHLNAGMQHLDGQKAHDFVRFRNYKNGQADLARVSAQQDFIKEIVKQKLTVSNINKIDDIYEMVNKNVRTNYGFDDLMSSFGTIANLKSEDITMYILPNTPKYIGGVSYVVYNTRENLAALDEILVNFKSQEK